MKNLLGPLILATATVVGDAGIAEACGGCFVPPSEATVVTDHRMALSMSKQETILWDQIRYSGDPREFAWVLPVRAGATIELANDEFFSALDASSQPVVYGPQAPNPLGCALTGCAADSAFSAFGERGPVQIISQSVVGPYEQVTLRATDEDALTTWLRRNEFTIPAAIEPTIEAYVREGFDFIALKLRPDCGERSMRPVRVVSPGAVPTLPLRMVAAGVGAQVGIILYVITEGKYRPQNFPVAIFEDRELRWDRFQDKSNYEQISQQIMGRENGRTWLMEYADKPQIPLTGTGWRQPSGSAMPAGFGRPPERGLADLYYRQCKSYRASDPTSIVSSGTSSSSSSSSGGFTPCPRVDAGLHQSPSDSGTDAASGRDAGDADAGDGGGAEGGAAPADAGNGSTEARTDGGAPSSSGQTRDLVVECSYLDDLDVAIRGLHREDVWVTRLRSVLPSTALTGGDLRLEPSRLPDGKADAEPVSSLHWTPYFAGESAPESSDKSSCQGSRPHHRRFGGWALGIASALLGLTWLRRRGSRRS